MNISQTNPDVPSTRIPLINPAIVAVMAEGQVVHPLIARLEPLVSAVDGAGADLAIAMWVRFREVMVEANRSVRVQHDEVAKAAKAERLKLDPTSLDEIIPSLPTHSRLLHTLGRHRAYAFVVSAFDSAQSIERSPTATMRRVLAAVQDHHALLLANLNDMIAAELDAHAAVVGHRAAPGNVQVHLSHTASDPSSIVIEH